VPIISSDLAGVKYILSANVRLPDQPDRLRASQRHDVVRNTRPILLAA
jgi:hypothetical protein